MTDHLSESQDEWPLNPFEVLGVPQTANKADVRRAYAVLIRRFHPETHPRHFQRIRQSYEAVLTLVQARNSDDGRLPAELRIDLSSLVRVPDRDSTRDESATGSFTGAAELIWDEFSQKQQSSQYDQIRQLAQSECANAEVLLIGYWMLKLHPAFAPLEQAAGWLIRGITACPLDARFVDLLLKEFHGHPELTLPGFSGRVASKFRNSELLCIYLHGRWTLLGQLRRWNQLNDEFAEMRPQLKDELSTSWFRLTMLCFRSAVFHSDTDAVELQSVTKMEIDRMTDRHLSHSNELDELDLLLTTQDALDFPMESETLQKILRECLILNDNDLRLRLLAFADEWIDSPDSGLQRLTTLASNYPEFIWLLMQRMNSLAAFNEPTAQLQAEMTSAVLNLLRECSNCDYHVARYLIAKFCYDHAITGMDLLNQFSTLIGKEPSAEEFSNALRRDAPLMITCQLIGDFLRTV